MITNGNDDTPQTKHSCTCGCNDNNTHRPADNCIAKNLYACLYDNIPLANGLRLVRSTFLSYLESHMSLIVHPAPRMMNDPMANNVHVDMKFGKEVVAAAVAVIS